MRRSYAALLAAVLVTAVGCTADEGPAAEAPVAESSSPSPTPAVGDARSAAVKVRPDWVSRDAPWLWEYSDDVVVVGPRSLVALDRETGAEVWRLPLGGPVCAATPVPSEIGLVAVSVGRCRPALQPTRSGARSPERRGGHCSPYDRQGRRPGERLGGVGAAVRRGAAPRRRG
ncbi:hypothetical protein LP418_04145 [Nocardioides sp. B-3]|nr:hypothetical protein [Nocardioides sp. B-3]UUZ61577.1 hypothetical protein LP418_04145 [Nocardioides sp. B-3]